MFRIIDAGTTDRLTRLVDRIPFMTCQEICIWLALALLVLAAFAGEKRSTADDSLTPPGDVRVDGPGELRIVGGEFRRRKLRYSGDPRVRPMKDRTREAIFNLIGPIEPSTYVWDLFGGTGAMAIEAISRGACGATIVERHIPTQKLIRENVEQFDIGNQTRLVQANVFAWLARQPDGWTAPLGDDLDWLVFCCPPYSLYEQQLSDLKQLLDLFRTSAPIGSRLVIEANAPFDFEASLWPGPWRTRIYRPAAVGVWHVAHDSDRPQAGEVAVD